MQVLAHKKHTHEPFFSLEVKMQQVWDFILRAVSKDALIQCLQFAIIKANVR